MKRCCKKEKKWRNVRQLKFNKFPYLFVESRDWYINGEGVLEVNDPSTHQWCLIMERHTHTNYQYHSNWDQLGLFSIMELHPPHRHCPQMFRIKYLASTDRRKNCNMINFGSLVARRYNKRQSRFIRVPTRRNVLKQIN